MKNLLIKNVLFFAFLMPSFSAFAQQPQLVSIETKDRLWKGIIDDKYEITIYLKEEQTSPNNGYIASLKGWYYYDNVGTRIPLVGIRGTKLTLFAASDETWRQNMIDFEVMENGEPRRVDGNMYMMDDELASVTGFDEKMILEFGEARINGAQGTWSKGANELKLQVSTNSFTFARQKQYIKFRNGYMLDLDNFGAGMAEFKIEAISPNGKNVLLSHSAPANLNYGGRCGGATNRGLLGLQFNDDFELESAVSALIEFCYRDILINDETEISENVTEITIQNYSDNSEDIYLVDRAKATLVKKK